MSEAPDGWDDSAEKARPREDEDAALVARCRAGEKDAFDELVRKHQEGLLRLVRRYVKVDEDARDVSQRALLRAFEKLDGFRGESSFRTWLFRIGVHAALNHLRGAPRVEHVDLDDVPSFTSSLETAKLVAAEIWQKVQVRLAELPPKQRLVVELRLFHELSFKEIGVLSDSSEDSAKVNYHHAVKKLRDLIQDA
jgi:RNA polymerase sigma-70 factor (ECF subfamily)